MKKIFRKSSIEFFLFFWLFICFFSDSVSSVYLPKTFAIQLRNSSLIIFAIYIIINCILRNGPIILLPKNKSGKLLIFIWSLFAISVGISEVIKFQIPITGLGFGLITLILFFILVPNGISVDLILIFKSYFYATCIFVLLSYLIAPNNYKSFYVGITDNSNNIGLLASQLCISSIILIFYQIKSVKNSWMLISWYTIFFLFGLYILFISGSRTAFISLIIVCIIILFYSINIKNFLFMIISPFFFYLFLNKYFSEAFANGILSKFILSNTKGSLSSGRTEIWVSTIKEFSLFGYGKDYFQLRFGVEAHNYIIDILGEFGLFPSIFLLVYSFLLISLLWRKLNRSFSIFNIIFLSYFLSILVILSGEPLFGVLTKSSIILFYILIGIFGFYGDERISVYENFNNSSSI